MWSQMNGSEMNVLKWTGLNSHGAERTAWHYTIVHLLSCKTELDGKRPKRVPVTSAGPTSE